MKSKKILVIGAHFDDAEMGVGGTLIKHVDKGDQVYLAVVETDEFRTGDPNVRLVEQYNAMKVLGLGKDRLLSYTTMDNDADIISDLDIVKPNVIYTPYYKDTHQAHRRASKIAQSVARKKGTTLIFFYCGSSIEFYPNMFSIIEVDRKNELIECHKTQIECGALKRSIRDKMESCWGALTSADENCYAEGLILRKMIYEV